MGSTQLLPVRLMPNKRRFPTSIIYGWVAQIQSRHPPRPLVPHAWITNSQDPFITQGGSKQQNSATGIGDIVARVKWNVWHGEKAGIAAGLDVRFPTGDPKLFRLRFLWREAIRDFFSTG